MMQFEIPKERPSIIKVIGVGGGGSNAVNHMFRLGIKGVDFMICNTDHQALEMSPVPVRVQLGPSLTDGRGAGSIPEIGKNAAIENVEEIRSLLSQNTKMVFITAGMGGGTGTGAAPIIAGLAKEMGILTVAIVTVPFSFEGKKRKAQADSGIEELKKNVDTLLVICNDRLREIHGNLKLTEAFVHADDVLAIAAKSIAETITKTLHINVDFADVQTVLKESGVAIMGSASAEGDERAIAAIMNALDSPLLNDNNIEGARYILLNITSGTKEVTMDELGQITDYIQEQAGNSAEVIMGVGNDESLGDKVGVTVIATGFKTKNQLSNVIPEKKEKVVFKLMDDQAPAAEPVAEIPAEEKEPVVPEIPMRSFSEPTAKPEPIIAEKIVLPSREEPKMVFVAPAAISQPQPESKQEEIAQTEVPAATPTPLHIVPSVESSVEMQAPTVTSKVNDEAGITQQMSDVPSAEAAAEPVIDTITHDAAPEISPVVAAYMPVAETPAEAPFVFQLNETEEAPAEEPVKADPMEPTLIVKNTDVTEEADHTFVFDVNSAVTAETEIPEAEKSIAPEPQIEQPVMKSIPPVETFQAPPTPAETRKESENAEEADAFQKARTRIMQLRELSMKMSSSSGLADLEKEPAYKRRNVQLSNLPGQEDAQISRYTLGTDQENKPEIRPNNPFLHDRVD
ncbi:MAG TPA: cell division protein FtsZ [Bacteroidia bacterium]|nr:cell division protein FtsZ [Bacteroidia bacterium]